ISDKLQPHVISMNDKVTLHAIWEPDNVFSILSIPFRILKLRPDLVHFNLHMAVFGKTRLANFVGLSIPFLCRLMGIPCIVTLHNIVERIKIEKTGMKNTFLNRLGTFLATKLLTLSSLLTVTVRSYVGFLRRRYKASKIRWVPHGAWNVKFSNPVKVGNPHNILYFGHHGPYKDPKLLFDAIRILSRKRGVKLTIAGSSHPNYPNFLEEHKSNNNLPNAHFLGFVPNDLIPDLFRKVNLLVLPYHTCTGTSGVAHLAASYGVPIVATDLPELRELANEGCGIVFCSHDPVSLAERIEYVLDNSEVAFELRERNLRFVQDRTWDKIARAFEKCYCEVLRRRYESARVTPN
ncbi:MAG: glycosyltransferase, partial [Candidatus Heimdallarchaeota archaeon]